MGTLRALSSRRLPRLLFAFIVAFVVWIGFLPGWNLLNRSMPPDRHSIRHALLQQLLLQDHELIAASNDGISYGGQWTAPQDQTRRLTSLPGAYLEFTVINSSSIYLSLRSAHQPLLSTQDLRQVRIINASDHRHSSASASGVALAVQLEGHDPVQFNHTREETLKIASNLQRARAYTVLITLLRAPSGLSLGALDLEGIWVSKGGYLVPSQRTGGSLPGTLAHQQGNIEVIGALPFSRATDAVSAYPVLLASALNMSHSLIPTVEHCLTEVCPKESPSIHSLYFRTGRQSAQHFRSVQRCNNSAPAALILSLGLRDFHHFLANEHSSQELDRYIDSFVHAYVAFVTTIRSASQNYMVPTALAGRSMTGLDASYIYNSAPNTLPVFLLTPFTSSRRLRRLLGHVVSGTARSVQANGDKTTIWIDTDGWLSAQDFRDRNNDDQGIEDLAESGHVKVATYLLTHLCPYLKQDCNFFKHDTFSGHLHVPAEAGMGKLLEERKLALIKDTMGMS